MFDCLKIIIIMKKISTARDHLHGIHRNQANA